jgi:hypothetical protein
MSGYKLTCSFFIGLDDPSVGEILEREFEESERSNNRSTEWYPYDSKMVMLAQTASYTPFSLEISRCSFWTPWTIFLAYEFPIP